MESKNVLEELIINSSDPCTIVSNRHLRKNINCNPGRGCGECIWCRNRDTNSKLMEIIDLLEVDDVS